MLFFVGDFEGDLCDRRANGTLTLGDNVFAAGERTLECRGGAITMESSGEESAVSNKGAGTDLRFEDTLDDFGEVLLCFSCRGA